jgi:hypothetical protein
MDESSPQSQQILASLQYMQQQQFEQSMQMFYQVPQRINLP